jgi:2-keto-3-deoxy-L-rhamnonate aldolase RhmA
MSALSMKRATQLPPADTRAPARRGISSRRVSAAMRRQPRRGIGDCRSRSITRVPMSGRSIRRGEILVAIMCEEVRAIKNLPKMLEEVPGIGVVIIGEGDLSQDLGYPRQYDHPAVAGAIDEILAICKQHNVPCGHPHVNTGNIEALLQKGFRYLMPAPVYSFAALEARPQSLGPHLTGVRRRLDRSWCAIPHLDRGLQGYNPRLQG